MLKILLMVNLGLVLRQPICVVCGLVCDDAILEPVTVPLNPATPEFQFLYFVFVYITHYMGSFSFQYIPLLVSFQLRLGSNIRFVHYCLNHTKKGILKVNLSLLREVFLHNLGWFAGWSRGLGLDPAHWWTVHYMSFVTEIYIADYH